MYAPLDKVPAALLDDQFEHPGYVTAFVQAYMQPPMVREFQSVAEDIAILRRWWQSRLLRIFLAFLLPTIGSVIGTWVGGTRIVSNLF